MKNTGCFFFSSIFHTILFETFQEISVFWNILKEQQQQKKNMVPKAIVITVFSILMFNLKMNSPIFAWYYVLDNGMYVQIILHEVDGKAFNFLSIHPISLPLIHCIEAHGGCWSQSHLTLLNRRGTPWKGHQSVTRQTHSPSHSHQFRVTSWLCLWGRKPTQACGECKLHTERPQLIWESNL